MVFGDVISRKSEKEGKFMRYRPKWTQKDKARWRKHTAVHTFFQSKTSSKKMFPLTWRSVAGKGNCQSLPVCLSLAVINLLHCIDGVKCSHPESSPVSSTRRVFGSSGLRSGHSDIILQSCFTRGWHRRWNPAMKIWKWTEKLHVVPVHKHHASEK